MAHVLLLSCSFEQLFASVLPSPRELSSPVSSFQLGRTSQGMSDIMIATNKEVLHSSARREDMLVSREGNLVTLINVFETTPHQQQALIEQWIPCTRTAKDDAGRDCVAL